MAKTSRTVAWSYGTEGHVQKCVERCCELANEKVEQLYKVSTPCLDDHRFKQEELESVRELSEVCSHIVLKCLHMARIGRPDILWSVNKLARSVTKWTQACDRRSARSISYIHHTNDFRQYCHDGTALQTGFVSRLRLCWRSGGLKVSLRRLYFWKQNILSQSVGCARNKLLSRAAPQSLRAFLWMLDYVWMGYLLPIFGTW